MKGYKEAKNGHTHAWRISVDFLPKRCKSLLNLSIIHFIVKATIELRFNEDNLSFRHS